MKYVLAVTILLCILSPACFADEATPNFSKAVLTVEVTNGTANGSPVAGDTVIVQIYQNRQLVRTLSGEVGPDGNAVFEDVPTGEQMVGLPRARHEDMMFNGPVFALSASRDKYEAHVEVYDVSHDTSRLSVRTHHMVIKASSAGLSVREFMQLRNASDTAIISDQKDDQSRPVVVEITLPKGFKNLTSLEYFEQQALVITKQGFYDTMAVPPGEYAVSFSYNLDITSDTMDIVSKLSVPTDGLVVFAELGQAELKGLGPPSQFTGTDGTLMDYYKHGAVAAMEEVTFQVAGFNVESPDLFMWIVMTAVFSAMLILAVLRLPGKKAA